VCGVCAGEVDKSWTGPLPSARDLALGKDFYFFLNFLCPVTDLRHSAKYFSFFGISLPRAS
jgi:hypothetical protein